MLHAAVGTSVDVDGTAGARIFGTQGHRAGHAGAFFSKLTWHADGLDTRRIE